MTLIIASANWNEQFIVADRRISKGGQLADDKAYKILYFLNPNQGYRFLIAYTGIAEWGSWKCIDWLTDILPIAFSSNNDLYQGIGGLVEVVQQKISSFTTLNKKYKRLTFVLCGYQHFGDVYTGATINAPFIASVSNCMDEDRNSTLQVSDEFRGLVNCFIDKSDYGICCAGDLDAASTHRQDFIQLKRYIRRPIPTSAKIELSKDFIRLVADSSGKKTVGKNILAEAILENGNAQGFDFPEDPTMQTRTLPTMILSNGSKIENIQIFTSENQGKTD